MKFENLYSSKGMARKLQLCGDIPDTKSLYKDFLKMAWPAMVESVLMSLVNLVDSVMVSRCGTNAVAAVGLTTQPRMIFYAVFFALSVGVTAIVSRRKGQNDREGANLCLAQSMGLVAVMAVILCGTAALVAEPLLVFSGANSDTLTDATSYFRITMIGLMFTSFGMIINAAQRGSGNTKVSMRTNVVANITNIIFNALLINGLFFFPKLGVMGAAIATLIGNIASFCMSVYSLFGKGKFLRFDFKNMFRWQKPILQIIGKVSLGAGVEQIFIRFGFFIYAKLVADLGTPEFATHTICMNITTISFACGDGLSVAASALIGQNLGKRRPDMATLYTKAGQRVGVIISTILVIIFVCFGDFLLELFAEPNDINYTFVMEKGRILTYLIALVTPGQISQVIYNGGLRGAGDTKFVAITSAISIGTVRPLTAYLLCYPLGFGLYGAWISLLIDQYMRLFFSIYRFMSGKWQKVNL